MPSALVLDIMVKGAVCGITTPYSDHTVDKRHCDRTDAAQAAEGCPLICYSNCSIDCCSSNWSFDLGCYKPLMRSARAMWAVCLLPSAAKRG
jgi:hypothetical protein